MSGVMRHNGVGLQIETLRAAGVDLPTQAKALISTATTLEAEALRVSRIPCGPAAAAGEEFVRQLREEARGMRGAAADLERQALIEEAPAAEVVV
jgi:hypothetical protein